MSGLNTLLKYRFTKKPAKIQHDGDAKSESSQDGNSSQGNGFVTAEVGSEPSLIVETPASSQPFPTSPGTNTTQNGESRVYSSNSTSDHEDGVEKESSGPWLSKKQGSLLHNFNDALLKKKKVTVLSFGRRRLKSDSESSSDDDDDDDDDEEKNDSNGSLSPSSPLPDSFDETRKRKNLSFEDSESPGGQPKRRRVKLLSESSVEDVGASSQETIPDSQVVKEKVNTLRETFPAATVERIKAVLKEKDYDLTEATEVLLADNLETEKSDYGISKDHDKGPDENVKPNDDKSGGAQPNGTGVNGHRVEVNDDYDDDDDDVDIRMEDDSDQEEESSERGPVLSFFEKATVEELSSMPGCSKKKAEMIISMRPFHNWETLVVKFETTKPLSYSLITRCWEIIQIREVVIRLMQRCEKISERLGSMVSALAGHVTMEELEDQITSQPKNLNPSLQMKPYQLVGLNWLRLMHTQELNGILADEMGLGKTVQAISFLAHLLEEGDDGPHIIVVPSSTIENWLRELTTWCPDLQVVLYYGSQEDRRRLRKEILYDESTEYNIVLTTYNMTSGSPEDRSLFKTLVFHYAVFDEGHMLKNMTSQRYQHLQKIQAQRRLLLTGTPLQNNLLELMSLLCFVMPDMFVGKTESLKRMFTMITKGDESRGAYEKERIEHAKNIMKPFLLRRLKRDVLGQLPRKVESIEFCPLIPQQQELYDNLVDAFSKKYMEQEKVAGDNAGGGAGMVMQLRKLANHPLLIRNIYTDEKLKEMAKKIAKEPSHRDRGALPHIIQEDMEVMSDFELHTLCQCYKRYLGEYQLESEDIENSGKFRFLDSFLEKKKTEGDRVLLFSQFTMMLDIVEAFVKLKGYKYLRLDGQTAVVDRQQMIDEYNQNKDIFVFLLSTRAGGMGINLTAANVVVLHDIDFNPYNDKQAEDRCHRVGQTRSVEVVKLISKGTVEEGMLSCAKFKLNLEKDVTSTDADDEENPSDVLSLLKSALGRHLKQEETNQAITEARSEAV